jgi:hypothetical protein
MSPTGPAGAGSAGSADEVEDLWDRHGRTAYALASALLGNDAAAEAVGLAISDLAGSVRGAEQEHARQDLARQVYRRAQALAGRTSDAVGLPPIIAWVRGLDRLQRESFALCAYGGLTHREAAALLEVPPSTVADLLRASLRELRHVIAGPAATCA